MAFFMICYKLVWMKWSTKVAYIMAIPMSLCSMSKRQNFKGHPFSSQFLKSMVCSAAETRTDCLMHHNTDHRGPLNNKYLLAVTFPLHCIYFMFISEFLLKIRDFFHPTYRSFLWDSSYHSLRNKCELLFNVIISRDLNHQNWLGKIFAS